VLEHVGWKWHCARIVVRGRHVGQTRCCWDATWRPQPRCADRLWYAYQTWCRGSRWKRTYSIFSVGDHDRSCPMLVSFRHGTLRKVYRWAAGLLRVVVIVVAVQKWQSQDAQAGCLLPQHQQTPLAAFLIRICLQPIGALQEKPTGSQSSHAKTAIPKTIRMTHVSKESSPTFSSST
jgi:hypothetical protein